MSKNKITIDDLAVMVQKGFGEMNEKFEGVNERLGHLERNQVKIISLLGSMATVERVEKLEERVSVLEKQAAV